MFWIRRNKMPITGQRILIVSDIHFDLSSKERKIFDQDFTQVWVLGDVPRDVLELINTMPCPKIGVLGNHDTHNLFDGLDIINMNGVASEVNGWYIAGIEGSTRYKRGTPYVMHSQSEAKKIMDKLPKVDILISHDSPYQQHDTEMHKEGFQAITKYLDRCKPLLHVYGHHHEYTQYKHRKTICVCNYRLGILERNGVYYQQNTI